MRKTKPKIKQFTVRIPMQDWLEHRVEAEKMFSLGDEASDNQLACHAIRQATEEMYRLNSETKYIKT